MDADKLDTRSAPLRSAPKTQPCPYCGSHTSPVLGGIHCLRCNTYTWVTVEPGS